MYDDCEMQQHNSNNVLELANLYLESWKLKERAANNFAKAIGWRTLGGDPTLFSKATFVVGVRN